MTTLERRYLADDVTIEERADRSFTIRGYAAVFNSLSLPLGGFREKVQPGAFADSLKDDVRALINHNPQFILGRTTSKTLQLEEDERGLRYAVDPPKTSYAEDLRESIKRKDITGSSFGFETITDKWDRINGENIRTLVKVRLVDVSPVAFPAYLDTSVATRSMSEWASTLEALGASADGRVSLDLRVRALEAEGGLT